MFLNVMDKVCLSFKPKLFAIVLVAIYGVRQNFIMKLLAVMQKLITFASTDGVRG